MWSAHPALPLPPPPNSQTELYSFPSSLLSLGLYLLFPSPQLFSKLWGFLEMHIPRLCPRPAEFQMLGMGRRNLVQQVSGMIVPSTSVFCKFLSSHRR